MLLRDYPHVVEVGRGCIIVDRVDGVVVYSAITPDMCEFGPYASLDQAEAVLDRFERDARC